MRLRVGLLFCLLVAFGAYADDYLWFEQEWISDADATVAANQMSFDALSPQARERYKQLFGKMRWTISDGTLTSKLPDGEPVTATYAIRAIDTERFEMILRDTDSGVQSVEQIHRSKRGFCVTPFTQEQIDEFGNAPMMSIECFRPYHG